MSKKIPRETICWSADVPVTDLMRAIDKAVLPIGTMIKLDQVHFERYGHGSINMCQEQGYKVFADRKISEIPEKALQIAECYLECHPYMLNVMAGICSTGITENDNPKQLDALKRFADLCAQAGTKSCGVTVLTSKTQSLVLKEYDTEPVDQVIWYAKLMYRAGMTDIVCSPLEAEALRKQEVLSSMAINTPGVRLPNTDVRDQARVSTPAGALDAGATRLVIGSNLTDGEGELAERLAKNYARIVDHLAEHGYEFSD